jgi:hypothetical protein
VRYSVAEGRARSSLVAGGTPGFRVSISPEACVWRCIAADVSKLFCKCTSPTDHIPLWSRSLVSDRFCFPRNTVTQTR